MKRTPLNRVKPMKRSNSARRKKTFERNFGERGAPVRAMPCLALVKIGEYRWEGGVLGEDWTLCQGPIAACHTIARGMGGAKGDKRNLVPLCAHHHTEAGERGTSQRAAFEARYGLDLQAEAERIAIELDGRGLS